MRTHASFSERCASAIKNGIGQKAPETEDSRNLLCGQTDESYQNE